MSPAEATPLVVGRYAIFDRIAAGGMATVHVARLAGEGGFARTVAIKRLHPQFALDPEFVAMFLDEARLTGRIRHPNVVPTLDVVAERDELFLVMEYVEGESLACLLRRSLELGGRVPVDIASGILVQALHGLHAAHEATSDLGEPLGLVHRDVSPQNVLVGTDGVARMLDFGVAKALGKLHTTREGQLKGKLGYLAPEQVFGHSVTRQTDVFAAAVVLWEAVTNLRLFAAESEGEVLRRIMDGIVEPPSRHAGGVPKTIDQVVMRALSKEPADRFDTALSMAEAIERATPVATTRGIAAWMQHLARERLDERARLIAAVESTSSLPPPSSRAPAVLDPSPGPLVEEIEKQAHTTISAVSAPPQTPPAPARRMRWPMVVALCSTAAAALFVGRSVRAPARLAPVFLSQSNVAHALVSPPMPVERSAPLAQVVEAEGSKATLPPPRPEQSITPKSVERARPAKMRGAGGGGRMGAGAAAGAKGGGGVGTGAGAGVGVGVGVGAGAGAAPGASASGGAGLYTRE